VCPDWCRHRPAFAWGTDLIGEGPVLHVHEGLPSLVQSNSFIALVVALIDLGPFLCSKDFLFCHLPWLVQAHSSIFVSDSSYWCRHIPAFEWGTGLVGASTFHHLHDMCNTVFHLHVGLSLLVQALCLICKRVYQFCCRHMRDCPVWCKHSLSFAWAACHYRFRYPFHTPCSDYMNRLFNSLCE
jgi:hypothetical protein